MKTFADKLCSVELDRVTAAEICIDECLTIMERHSERSALYSTLCSISDHLNNTLVDADGMEKRYERLTRVRQALTTAFPMTDEDLQSPQEIEEPR